MSVRSDRNVAEIGAIDATSMPDVGAITLNGGMDHVNATITAAQNADAALGDANALSTNSPHHPLQRTIAVNIRASLGDLCLRKQKATWAPSAEALRTILQQRKVRARPRLRLAFLAFLEYSPRAAWPFPAVHGLVGHHGGPWRSQERRAPLHDPLKCLVRLRCPSRCES